MSDIKVTKIDDIAAYAGPNVIRGMRMRGAARALGITAWAAVTPIPKGQQGRSARRSLDLH